MKRALLIGINYIGSSYELQGTDDDVRNVSALLKSRFGYTDKDITLMDDSKATKAGMIAEFNKFVLNLKPGDQLLLHYSGHGGGVNGGGAGNTDGLNQALIPVDYSQNGVILDEWLYKNIASKIPSGVTFYAFIDCCHSGSMFNLKYNVNNVISPKVKTPSKTYNTNEWNEKYTMNIQPNNVLAGNICIFSGSLDSQTAADAFINGQETGAFTFCLVSFMKNYNNGTLKMNNLLKRLNVELHQKGFKQQSQLSLGNISNLESFIKF